MLRDSILKLYIKAGKISSQVDINLNNEGLKMTHQRKFNTDYYEK